MTRKTKISILIITIYLISLFLFELFIGTARTLEYVEECVEQDMFNVLAPLVTPIEAGIWHFICVSIVAIICKFIKPIDKSYKNIIYAFPIITFIFSIPVGLMTLYISSFFGWFGI